MTPSERIDIIQRIAAKLKNLEWAIIDLTLRQFGLPTSEDGSWANKQYDYSIAMTEGADDETLSQLHLHLADKKSSANSSSSLDFWQPGTFRVFISHRSSDKSMAKDLKTKLDDFHISSFVAHEDIKPTKAWQEQIELALSTCDCVIALVTPDFHASAWTDQELGIAIGKEKLIIPINYGEKPYGFLSKYQWLRITAFDPAIVGKSIFQILVKHTLSKRKFSSALVNQFESSSSFVSAKYNMGLLEQVEYLDYELIKRIQNAHDTNSQIQDAFGVTERVQRLVSKISQS